MEHQASRPPEWFEKTMPVVRVDVWIGDRTTKFQQLSENLWLDESTGDIYECIGDNMFNLVSEAV